jgi:hypothetical protein
MKLAVGWPWSSAFSLTAWADAMLDLQRPSEARDSLGRMQPVETRFFRGRGWCPARRHAHICEQALDWGADLILVVGADQVHPPDMLQRLIARWNQGFEVVTALVPARGYVGWQEMKPFQPMAWRIKPGASLDMGSLNALGAVPNEVEVIDPAAGEMQRVDFIGSGVLMFHRDHLLALKQPWFTETFDEEFRRTACMDTKFVWRLQAEAGAEVWVDTTIKVKHLHVFEIDETYSGRFADWAEPGTGDPAICNFAAGAAGAVV